MVSPPHAVVTLVPACSVKSNLPGSKAYFFHKTQYLRVHGLKLLIFY